jgi:hypothetical protein
MLLMSLGVFSGERKGFSGILVAFAMQVSHVLLPSVFVIAMVLHWQDKDREMKL